VSFINSTCTLYRAKGLYKVGQPQVYRFAPLSGVNSTCTLYRAKGLYKVGLIKKRAPLLIQRSPFQEL